MRGINMLTDLRDYLIEGLNTKTPKNNDDDRFPDDNLYHCNDTLNDVDIERLKGD